MLLSSAFFTCVIWYVIGELAVLCPKVRNIIMGQNNKHSITSENNFCPSTVSCRNIVTTFSTFTVFVSARETDCTEEEHLWIEKTNSALPRVDVLLNNINIRHAWEDVDSDVTINVCKECTDEVSLLFDSCTKL